MSLVIKGINKPKEGEMIVIGIQPTDAVVDTWETSEVDGEDVFVKREHIKHADIIQIPEGHGDIKDTDELRKGLEADTREAFTRHDVWLMLSKYNTNAPTILETED